MVQRSSIRNTINELNEYLKVYKSYLNLREEMKKYNFGDVKNNELFSLFEDLLEIGLYGFGTYNEYKKPWRVTDHVFGKLGANNEYRWIVDVDNFSEISKVIMCIKKCESRYDNPIITQLQTKSGIHIITHTFNSQKFKTLCVNYGIETPDIKKNHITLLYENI